MRSSQHLFNKELAAAKELEKKRAEQRTEKYAAELAIAKKWQCKKSNLSIGMNEKRCISSYRHLASARGHQRPQHSSQMKWDVCNSRQ